MKTPILNALALSLMLLSFAAPAQNTARVRGTIASVDGKVLAVKSVEGKDLKLLFASDTSVVYSKTITLADLRPGEYVGITSTRNSAGILVAREVPYHFGQRQRRPPAVGSGPQLEYDECECLENGQIRRRA